MAQKRKNTTKQSRSSAGHTAARKKANGQNRQLKALLLFALAILMFCLAVISAGSMWGQLRKLLLGLFGLGAFVAPFVVGYLAVLCALEKPSDKAKSLAWKLIILLVLLSTIVQVFLRNVIGISYGEALVNAYQDGALPRGAGVLGALLGYWLERWFTDIGARIILLLLLFIYVMIVTGTTIITLLKALWKPVQKTRATIETAVETGRKRKETKIDVALDDEANDGATTESEQKPVVTAESLGKVAADLAATEDMILTSEKTEAVKTEEAAEKPAAEPEKADEVEEFIPEPPAEQPKAPADYRYPPLSLLNEVKGADSAAAAKEQAATAELLTKTLQEFGVNAKVIDASRGPTVTRYELQPSAGVKISRITGLADDIALRLATTRVRIEAPIPNKAAVGIEVPNRVSGSVGLRELIDTKEFASAESKLTVALGRDIAGHIVLADLAKMPHLLIAGTTGSGKSVCTNSMIQSVLFRARPDEVKMLLIDPKQVEFGIYNGIPHLLTPVVTEPRKAAGALGWAVNEMMRRYQLFSATNARDIDSYNEMARSDESLEHLPQILIVIDELADLMMVAANAVESNICRLAQMARAAGMHLVIATQRPSVDVITGLIKANIPSRLALTVASAVDSRTILDASGAEKLLGKGDMLFMPLGYAKPVRVQGCFVSGSEVKSVVEFLKQTETQQYDESVEQEIIRLAQTTEKSGGRGDSDDKPESLDDSDEMLPQAIEVVVEAGMASTSLLQRKLRLGYARAGRIIDEMETRGIVGPHEGSKPRQVLITRQQWLEMNMNLSDSDN